MLELVKQLTYAKVNHIQILQFNMQAYFVNIDVLDLTHFVRSFPWARFLAAMLCWLVCEVLTSPSVANFQNKSLLDSIGGFLLCCCAFVEKRLQAISFALGI